MTGRLQRPLLSLVFAGLAPAAAIAAKTAAPAIRYECPDGYRVKEGLNIDFPHKGEMRAFIVAPPVGATGAAPVWVPLTGAVESTRADLNVAGSGTNALMAQKGFMVIRPVRQCSDQNPDDASQACNGAGRDGWTWKPSAHHPGGFELFLVDAKRRPCGLPRGPWPQVDAGEHPGVQPLGADHPGLLS